MARMQRYCFTLCLFAALAAAPNAYAGFGDDIPDAAPAPTPTVSLTFSPIHLLAMRVVEVMGEYQVHDRVGISGILGYGTVESSGIDVTVFEIGAQGAYYVLGDFRHGLHVGAEAIYLGASADKGTTSAVAAGLAVGPMIGYKYSASFGLTFLIQGGVEYMLVKGDAKESTTGTTASAEKKDTIPLLNINLGWSF